MMTLPDLQLHIRTLATLEPTESPVISCYLDLTRPEVEQRSFLGSRLAALRQSQTPDVSLAYHNAGWQIADYLEHQLSAEAAGLALFARGGEQPFFLPLQFGVPLPNWLAVHQTPNLYHLVELKDTYHRYVLVILTRRIARILEINLGSVTEELWSCRPELRERVGSGWTREQYRHHREQQTAKYIEEKIAVLNRLMKAGGHTHLVLAGDPALTTRLKEALPRPLAAKLVDVMEATVHGDTTAVVAATVARFVELEARAELRMVEEWQRGLHHGDLAVAGTEETLRVLHRQQVDVVLLDSAFATATGWSCPACGAVTSSRAAPASCPECRQDRLRAVNLRDEMVRLAERQGGRVEVVAGSEVLQKLGGVGCLLRYAAPEQYLG